MTPTTAATQERTTDARVPPPRGAAKDMATRADEGFFGPGSVAWKVWTFPTSALQGFFRAVTIEHLDPDLVAAVDDSGQVYKRTPTRYDRTIEYFAAVLFADAQTVTRMSDILMKVHDRSYGTNPVTGNDFEANRPSSQLWILVTAWHSILYTYEKFDPGKLSRDEENEYWEQMVTAAKFQPIDPADVPKTRGEALKHLDDWREKLSASEAAIRNVDHIIDGGDTAFVGLPTPIRKVLRPLFRRSIIATYPHWMRPMLGVKQSKAMDQLMFWGWKPFLAAANKMPWFISWVVERICPRALRYIKPVYYKVPADSPKVYTPEVARRMFGNPLTPLEQREELLEKRRKGAGQDSYGHNHVDQILEFSEADDEESTKRTLAAVEESTKALSKAS
ncbi:MAG TPA: DUF2236 domain-containing protein [Candidatus Corynebacterium faecigallinarum]|uniref:DUF2236 domain-containing protein n=1 Tax=Candidatus Corynebacterium faecigallinarum TaxID=2838528 RepID=A0A9D2TQV1_9CORY|nr:DUF2236 domain-containing protein [Candidatus Corynebacterium faecigallinarum]